MIFNRRIYKCNSLSLSQAISNDFNANTLCKLLLGLELGQTYSGKSANIHYLLAIFTIIFLSLFRSIIPVRDRGK